MSSPTDSAAARTDALALPGLRLITAELRSPLLILPVQTAVVALDGARVLLSPASTLTAEQLRDAGPVTDIVAPSLMHTAGMKAAAAAHPTARLWGPAGVAAKQPGLPWHGVLGTDPWPHEAELPAMPLPGAPKLNECLFLHRASRTLLVTDLAFNVAQPRGLLAWLFFRMFGTYKRFAVSKLFLGAVKDRPAFEAALGRVLEHDFDHVVVSHGAPVLGDGKARLTAALRERGLVP